MRKSRKKAFRKLKRLELVELIYQLRKDNLSLSRRCEELEKQLRSAEKMAQAYVNRTDDEALSRIESMLAEMVRRQSGETPNT